MEYIYEQIQLISQYNYLLTLIQWDLETEMPAKAQKQTASAVSFISEKMHDVMTGEKFLDTLKQYENAADISDIERKMISELLLEVRKMERIPKEEYVEYQELLNRAHAIWVQAKEQSDYALFEPTLAKIVAYQKKLISYYGYEAHPYDALLNEYERNLTVEKLDKLFQLLKERLLPLLKAIQTSPFQIDRACFDGVEYPIEQQKEFCFWLAEYLGFDYDAGVLKESEHPFSMSLDKNNVRMTTHYYANNLESSISSVIHETGHSLYEQGVSDNLAGTLLDGGTSMGIHESQSRFYENIVGKDIRFWTPIYPRLQKLFPEQLSNVSCETFVQTMNRVVAGPIRIEADELTYPFHVMIRYEIEKMLFEDKITTADIPRIWNSLYKEYLGLDIKNDAEGVLQDVHWSMGSFGYFPTYVVGSAYASQFTHIIEKDIDMDKALSGELHTILEYLCEHVHQYGKLKIADEIIMDFTNETFNPEYYVSYLYDKFSKVYQLSPENL
ncbi:MAG: carboxypeptidase M32 [Culicoidibacterales bacterium]